MAPLARILTKVWTRWFNLTGRFSTKKDNYLTNLIMGEPRARLDLRPLERSTLTGFVLREGQLEVDTLNELGIGPDSEKKKKHKASLGPHCILEPHVLTPLGR